MEKKASELELGEVERRQLAKREHEDEDLEPEDDENDQLEDDSDEDNKPARGNGDSRDSLPAFVEDVLNAGQPRADAQFISAMDLLNEEKHLTLAEISAWPERKLKDFVNNFTPQQLPDLVKFVQRMGGREPPASMSFRNLFYKKDGVLLVNGVSGYLKPGMLVAIIGDDAAPLLEVLAGRQTGGVVSGERLINGAPPDESIKRVVGYISKDDIHLPTLTVRETLQFSGQLRSRQSDIPIALRMVMLEIVLKMLGLQNCADTVVGDGVLRGISGGEKRRVSVAVEVVAGHSIILADQPTNGLDSAAALRLVKNTRRSTTAGLSAMHSIVQPSPELLGMYDHLLLLSRGTCIYFGPPQNALNYFKKIGFDKPYGKSVPDFLEELAKSPEKFFIGKAPLDRALVSKSGAVDSKQVVLDELEAREKKHILAAKMKAAMELPEETEQQGQLKLDRLNEVLMEETKLSKATLEKRFAATAADEKATDVVATADIDVDEMNITQHAPEVSIQKGTKRDCWDILVRAYRQSPDYRLLGEVLWTELTPVFELEETKPADEYNTGFVFQVISAVIRQFNITARNKAVSTGGLIRSAFMAVLLGSIFFQLGETQGAANSRIGLLFYVVMFNGTAAMQTIPLILQQRLVFYTQQSAGYFRAAAYFIAYMLVSSLFASLETSIFCMIVYPMAGFQGGFFSLGHFFFTLVCVVTNLTSRALAFFASYFFASDVAAQAITPLLIVMCSIFNGYLVPRNAIPDGWIWLHYSSIFTYSLRALTINEYVGLTFRCTDDELVPQGVPKSTQICPTTTGEQFLARYNMETDNIDERWHNLGYLIIFYFFFHFIAALTIIYVRWTGETTVLQKRKTDEYKPIAQEKQNDDHKPKKCYVEFDNLTYSVRVPAKSTATKNNKKFCQKKKYTDRVLLQNVFGYAPPGRLIALMGASGAGKTTLLDVLAGKKTGGQITGRLVVNNLPKDKFFNRYVGYVEQFDAHVPTATVREAVTLSATLRLPSTLSKLEKEARVERVLHQLDLTHVADEKIGNVEKGGLAPELRKKVTIAVELVIDPGVLFLDEPTTGLSSAAALEVMQTVRKLANDICVICTIHQPSQEIVDKVDWLLLLQKGGTVAYFGPKDNLVTYFEREQLGKYEKGRNIADFALEALGNRTLELEAKREDIKASNNDPAVKAQLTNDLSARDASVIFLSSAEGQEIKSDLSKGVAPKELTPPSYDSYYASDPFTQFFTLVQRTWVGYKRDPSFPVVRFGTCMFMSFIIGLLYFQLGNDQTDANSRVSIIFLSLLFCFFSANSVMTLIVNNRPVVFRETHSNMYSVTVYYLARVVSDVPLLLGQAFVYTTIFYWIAGLRGDDHGIHYGQYLAAFYFVVSLGFANAEFWADTTPSADVATGVSIVVLNIMMLFTGFLIVKEQIPQGWIWMFYFNMIRYPLFYLVGVELRDQAFACPDGVGAITFPINTSNPACSGASSSDPNCFLTVCPITNGNQIMQRFSIEGDQFSQYFGVMVAFYVALRLFNYISLRKLNWISK